MSSQKFRLLNSAQQSICLQPLKKTQRPVLLILSLLAIVLAVSCKKGLNEAAAQESSLTRPTSQSSGANVSNSEELIPYDQTLFVPCGNGGAGQEIALTGSLKIFENIVYNDNGFALNYHVVAQGISGVGLSTGEKFQASGGADGTITGEFDEYGRYSRIFKQQLRIIGQNMVFKINYKIKLTITPGGKITNSIENETIECL